MLNQKKINMATNEYKNLVLSGTNGIICTVCGKSVSGNDLVPHMWTCFSDEFAKIAEKVESIGNDVAELEQRQKRTEDGLDVLGEVVDKIQGTITTIKTNIQRLEPERNVLSVLPGVPRN